MPASGQNPLPAAAAADRHAIREMLAAMADDLEPVGLLEVNTHRSPHPDGWRLSFGVDDRAERQGRGS